MGLMVFARRSRVESLDQLFAQAAGCDSFLRSKVKAWAKESDGMLAAGPDDSLPQLLTWKQIEEKNLQDHVQWARCKKPDRAMAKAFFAYGGKVSYLVDLCRQRIAFNDVTSLGLCLVRVFWTRRPVACARPKSTPGQKRLLKCPLLSTVYAATV